MKLRGTANPPARRPRGLWRRLAAALALAACAGAGFGVARAEPGSGFGVFGGLAFHKGNVQLADGGTSGFVSSGLDGGAEYQRVVTPAWSLVGLVQTSVESVAGEAAKLYVYASHSIVGAEARYWDGPRYVGVRLGGFSEALAAKPGSGAKDTQAAGWGYGLSGGWEGRTGWFAAGQVDLAEVSYTNAAHGFTGIRVHLGYRWPRE